jgi:hypothetical protein
MTEEEPTKTCAKCKVLKSVAEFSKDRSTKDGLQNRCKVCQKEYRQTNKSKINHIPAEELPSKVCKKCRALLPRSEFHKNNSRKDGLFGSCKACVKAYGESRKEEIADYKRAYQALHKDRIAASQRKYHEENKDELSTQAKAYREEHKEALRYRKKKYYEENKPEIAVKLKDYYDTHKESLAVYKELYNDKHKARIVAYRKRHYAEHKDEYAERSLRWQQANREKTRAYGAKYRGRKLNAIPAWFEKEAVDAVYAEASARSQTEGVIYHVDHIIPLQSKFVCGLHCLANLEVILGEENCSKGNRYWPGQEWIVHS